jgi:hypothetical protein
LDFSGGGRTIPELPPHAPLSNQKHNHPVQKAERKRERNRKKREKQLAPGGELDLVLAWGLLLSGKEWAPRFEKVFLIVFESLER